MLLSERQLSFKRTLKQQLIEGNTKVDFDELSRFAEQLSNFLYKDLTHEEMTDVVAEITMEEEIVFTGAGTVYDPATFKKWIEHRRDSVQHSHWNAYKQLLISRDWARPVIDDIEQQAEEVVELMGDPLDGSDFARRGLLLGEVQSGKTATYIGILNKAIDYGYRLIIVIGGHTNDLRRQTQSRLDSDLIGYDTSLIGENIATSATKPIGVAEFDASIRSNVLTTIEGDFSKGKTRSGLNWIQDTLPTVLVIKKNATVIKNVTTYIKQQANGGRLDMPLVLIDDEADWGTPNTGSDTDPTRVNAEIRRLLDTSRRSSYLGITATPFANIFIDHVAENEDLGQDLFPADYIRVMSSPSNYYGIQHYFSDDSPAIRCDVDDCIRLLPIKHKKTHALKEIPASLKSAIIAFYLGAAVRLKRNEGKVRSASMLVNMSRFNDVQSKIEGLIIEFSSEIRDVILAEALRDGAPSDSDLLSDVKGVWKAEFEANGLHETWREIAPWLGSVVRSLRVELVNRETSGARNRRRRLLTPEQRRAEDNRPTIYVGGDVLARGLTLEGLQVSYFVREPRTMDTLMQMGRWFGYRPGYEDLVRIWMPSSTKADFAWSSDVTRELRELLLLMRAKELTPRDFGLRLRAHPGGFDVVAGRKRQSATLTQGEVLIHGNSFESYYLDSRNAVRQENFAAAAELLMSAKQLACEELTVTGYRAWRGLPLSLLEEFFTKFRGDKRDPFFGFATGESVPQIVPYLGDSVGAEKWDVVLVKGSAEDVEIAGMKVRSSLRNAIRQVDQTLELGNRRVATASNLAGSLSPETRAVVDANLDEDKKITESLVLESIANPMILLYMLTTDQDKSSGEMPAVKVSASDPLVAVVLAFPALDVEEAVKRLRDKRVQKFWVNTVWLRSMRGYLDDGDDIEDGDDQ